MAMMSRTMGRRVARLEQWLAPERKHRIVVRYAGPGSERCPQPTQQEIDESAGVITVRLVGAKEDERPVEQDSDACERPTSYANFADECR